MSEAIMAEGTISEANELHARLRNLCLSWPEGYALASACALQAVIGLRSAFNEFAEKDPYEAGKIERWDLSADVVEKEPVVAAMARTFSLILNHRGLLKIDPS
jgi:hypothetical protein